MVVPATPGEVLRGAQASAGTRSGPKCHDVEHLVPLREIHLHHRADVDLASAPAFRLPVDPDAAGGDQGLGLAPVHDDAGELEQLPEADAGLADFDVHEASVA